MLSWRGRCGVLGEVRRAFLFDAYVDGMISRLIFLCSLLFLRFICNFSLVLLFGSMINLLITWSVESWVTFMCF